MFEYEAEQDEALMRRVRAGETACFAELVRRYRPALVRVARSRLGDPDRAEDAVQETLLAAYKGRGTFDASRSFRTWLWTILLNRCKRIWSDGRRLPATVEGAAASHGGGPSIVDVPGREPSPLAQAVEREQTAALESLLARLSPAQADALRLRFYGQLKFHEIAAAMGCSLLTAKNRVKWGLLRLADELGKTANEVEHDRL